MYKNKNLGGEIPLMLKITEVAELYNLPVHFVRSLVNNGEVVATRVGNKILVNVEKFGEFLNSNTIKHQTDGEGTDRKAYPKNKETFKENRSRIRPINRCK